MLPGDVLYYWLYVQRYGLGYRKDASYWIVDGRYPCCPGTCSTTGSMSRDTVPLLPGDVLYYWLYVQRYGLGYRKDASYWIVDGRYRCCPGTCSTTGSTSRDTVPLLPGDVLYYWLYVQRYGLGYRKDASYWIVDGLQSIPMLTAPHVSQVQPPLKPALAPTAQEIISTVMKNNCSSLGLNHGPNRDPLLYLLEGYEFVMVVKDGQLQLKDRPLPAETTKV
ncbi:uncharacterized protein LOC134532259 [Bacillus rossius redtenbacheri]|uniref:uncharacterized protein LOC134532259 n=1 Tax=Bacillus rossius redtenbacheri TaxID=93214 RepID=UPI002FDDFFE3